MIFFIGVTGIFRKEICEEISGSVTFAEVKKKFSKQNEISVNLGENIEVNCGFEKSVRSVLILAKRNDDTEGDPYYFKILVNSTNKMVVKKKGLYAWHITKIKISDEDIKLSFNVQCIHNKVSILCFKRHTCHINSTSQIDITSNIINRIILKDADGMIIEKAHTFSKVEGPLSQTYGLALSVTFTMCQSVIYHYVRTVGFGTQIRYYSRFDSKTGKKNLIVVFFVYKDNCRYNIEPYITTTVVFPFRTEIYRVNLDVLCFHSEAYVVYLFLVVFCFFVCGWSPVLMVRKRWFETDLELRLIRAHLRKKSRSSQVTKKRGSKMT